VAVPDTEMSVSFISKARKTSGSATTGVGCSFSILLSYGPSGSVSISEVTDTMSLVAMLVLEIVMSGDPDEATVRSSTLVVPFESVNMQYAAVPVSSAASSSVIVVAVATPVVATVNAGEPVVPTDPNVHSANFVPVPPTAVQNCSLPASSRDTSEFIITAA